MSVIVKGMEMPNIPAFREKDNKVAFPAAVVLEKGKAPRLVVNYKIGYVDTNLKAYELVEVPTPHGRLIDADELIRYLNEWISDPVALSGFTRIINHQPTISEAEVSE